MEGYNITRSMYSNITETTKHVKYKYTHGKLERRVEMDARKHVLTSADDSLVMTLNHQ